ncbi:MAG TPA: hypothetical protein VE270_01000 [Thermoleophilaceae bacterium]|nr:hypothetical protein [Thermoleophilaceae bacterium]
MSAPELSCPSCGRAQVDGSAFCAGCGMPLVEAGEPLETPLSESHERARKINPVYTEGRLVRVAGGRNQAEAELIQNLLLEEGVPSVLRRTAGFDVPDFLAAGPRDVMVPLAGVEAARDVLLEARLAPAPADDSPGPNPVVLFLTVLLGTGVAALVAWLIYQGG